MQNEEELQSKDVFTLPCILNKIITSAAEIEKLKFFWHDHRHRANICESVISIKNLTRHV